MALRLPLKPTIAVVPQKAVISDETGAPPTMQHPQPPGYNGHTQELTTSAQQQAVKDNQDTMASRLQPKYAIAMVPQKQQV